MTLNESISILNKAIASKQPEKLTSSWIFYNLPSVYRYIWKNVRTGLGDIDWDCVISKIDKPFQKRWVYNLPKKVKPYRNIREVRTALNKYKEKLYVFISPLDEEDRLLRDTISIALVRVAQKGNIRAQQELVPLLRFMVDQWIDYSYRLKQWKGYGDEIEDRLKACIRCYRFTGTFIGYVFKTLEYAGRGIRPMQAYSLDDTLFDGQKRIIDNVVQDSETNEIRIY